MKRKLLVVGIIATLGIFMLSFSGSRPANLGVTNGQLLPLPDSPNAVSTQTDDASRKLPALAIERDSASALDRIVEIVNSMARTKIVKQTDDYLHVEFSSLIFRFVDDVEFFVDAEEKMVHFRSASRIGHSDLGANRKRMETVSRQFSASAK